MEESKQTKERMSNFELLRIVCMLLIVAHHFSVHSTLQNATTGFNLYLYRALAVGGKVAVNIYVLISGYFMINSQFKFKKLLSLIFETIFYSVTIYICFCIFGVETFDFNVFINQIFPIFTSQYWFMSFFVILYALSPFLNKVLKQCTIKEFVILLFLLLIYQIRFFDIQSSLRFSELAWFVVLYITAAFIRLYFDNNNFNIGVWLVFVFSLLIILIGYIVFNKTFWGLTGVFCYTLSISIFFIFKNLKIKNNKFINLVSSTTLGIYLIHDNRFIRPYVWNKWLNVGGHFSLNSFWLFVIVSILLVFVVCSVIDFLRRLMLKLSKKLVKKYKQ